MSHRFYLPDAAAHGQATLAGPEAHHLLHVLRASVGDQVLLFDGQGGEYTATVEQCSRNEVRLTTGERRQASRELPVRIALGVALPKGDRQRWLVEKLTELGVAELVPLSTERSVADLRGKSLERLERGVVEACKQCGRNTLMTISTPRPLGDFLASASGVKLVAHPTGESVCRLLSPAMAEVSIVIGPEGGLTDDEVALASQHGWTTASLGASILRIETAAVAVAAIVGNHRP